MRVSLEPFRHHRSFKDIKDVYWKLLSKTKHGSSSDYISNFNRLTTLHNVYYVTTMQLDQLNMISTTLITTQCPTNHTYHTSHIQDKLSVIYKNISIVNFVLFVILFRMSLYSKKIVKHYKWIKHHQSHYEFQILSFTNLFMSFE